MHYLKVLYLKLPSTRSFSSRATFAMITQDDSLPTRLARLPLQRSHSAGYHLAQCPFKLRRCSYLFHVSVVHGVIRHFIWLQLNNLFQLIAIAFPLADNDNFIKQENIPGDTYRCIVWKMWFESLYFFTHFLEFFRVWTHRSCFVRLTMEHTFSSPSIFGLPYSSSFTCCLGHMNTLNVNPLHTMACKFNEEPWIVNLPLNFWVIQTDIL